MIITFEKLAFRIPEIIQNKLRQAIYPNDFPYDTK